MADPYIGEIRMVCFPLLPKGWLQCDGSLLNVQQYLSLFSLLGARYGGDGNKTFGLPDLRGTVPVGASSAYGYGRTFGSEVVQLKLTDIPSHTHLVATAPDNGTSFNAASNYFGTVASPGLMAYAVPSQTATLNPATISAAGGSWVHDNMQPYITLSYIIATTGLYPPRD